METNQYSTLISLIIMISCVKENPKDLITVCIAILVSELKNKFKLMKNPNTIKNKNKKQNF